MDNRPIGVFDSGVGGLTAMRELVFSLPGEDIVYFGDTGRVPYGGRSRSTLLKYAAQDIRFLSTFFPKAILIACGTVSAHLESLQKPAELPLVGVVRPTAERAAGVTGNGRVGIIGTKATVQSGAYERELKSLRPDLETLAIPCPLFVPLVENGRVNRGDIILKTISEEYLAPFREFQCDTLILGCTHYPLLREVISDTLPLVRLIDSGAESSAELRRLLTSMDALSGRSGGGKVSYYVSDDPETFSLSASLFMGGGIGGTPKKVDIENF